jgi:hypothetical protein
MLCFPIGWTISHVLMADYYLVVTPIGLIMRALKRDPMQRAFDRQAEAVDRPPKDENTGRYFRQF